MINNVLILVGFCFLKGSLCYFVVFVPNYDLSYVMKMYY